MTRQYFLTGSLATIQAAIEQLRQQPFTGHHAIHVISLDKAGVKRHQLPAASAVHTRDIVRGAELGTLTGTSIGLMLFCANSLIVPFMDIGLAMQQAVFLALWLLPTLLGCVVGALLGWQRTSYKISRFEIALRQGQHLLMIDSEPYQASAIKALLGRFQLSVSGTDSTWITPFDEHDSEQTPLHGESQSTPTNSASIDYSKAA